MREYANVRKTITCLATVAALIGGCAVESSNPTPAPRADAPARRPVQTKIAWLMQTSGSDSGGFFATHPATDDRIDALEKVSAR